MQPNPDLILKSKMKSNPNPNANKRTLSVPAPIPIPIPGSSSSSSTAFSAHRHRLNTAYDYSSLRLRSEGSRSSRIPSSNLNFRVSKAVVRDLRGNWIAKDVGGGFGRVPMTLRKRKKSTPTEHGQGSYVGEDENEASLVKVDGKSESTPRSNERAAKRRRVLEDDLDFLSAPDPQPQPQSSPPTVSEPAPDSANAVVTGTGTQPDVSQARDNLLLLPHERALSLPLPSSDLLKFIHHFASSFYHERGELFNATKAVRREKRIRMKAKLEQKRMEEEEEEEEEMSRVQPMPTRSSSRRGANRARTKEQQGNVSGEDMEPSDDLVDVDAEHVREEENLERRGSQSSPPLARQKSNNSPSPKAKGKGKANATINTKHHPNRSAPQSPSRPVRRPASPSPSASSFHLSEDEGTEVDTDRDGEELNQDQNNDAQSDAKEKRKRKNRGMGYRGARRKNHQTDMYRVFDGSALMAIGMLIQEHVSRMLEVHIPEGWEESMKKLGEYSDDEEEESEDEDEDDLELITRSNSSGAEDEDEDEDDGDEGSEQEGSSPGSSKPGHAEVPDDKTNDDEVEREKMDDEDEEDGGATKVKLDKENDDVHSSDKDEPAQGSNSNAKHQSDV